MSKNLIFIRLFLTFLNIMVIVLVTFHWHKKIPVQINLKEEKFIFSHGVRSFSPWSAGCSTFRIMER
jgi:hypothetical protein